MQSIIRLTKQCDWANLRKLLEKATAEHLDIVDEYGMNALHWAATEKNIPVGMLDLLIELHPDSAKVLSNSGYLPLHLAIMAGASMSRVQRLVDAYPQGVSVPTSSGLVAFALWQSANQLDTRTLKRGENMSSAQMALVYGKCTIADVLQTKPVPASPSGRLRKLRKLSLRRTRTSMEDDPVKEWDWDIVQQRIEESIAEPKLAKKLAQEHDERGRLLLHGASRAPIEIFDWLLQENPIAVKSKSHSGLLPLHMAVRQHASPRRLQRLIDAYPESICVESKNGDTPLDWADRVLLDPISMEILPNQAIRLAEASDWDGLGKLIASNPLAAQTCDSYGMLPLHWASTEANVPIDLLHTLLKAYPIGVKTTNKANLLPLHIAIRAHVSLNWIQGLLDAYPQSVWIETNMGLTPMGLSVQVGASEEILHALRLAQLNVHPEDVPERVNNRRSSNILVSPSKAKQKHSLDMYNTLNKPQSIKKLVGSPANMSPSNRIIDIPDDESSSSSEENNELVDYPTEWRLHNECSACHAPFSMFKHRHHCRSCGQSICQNHTAEKKIMTKGFHTPQRVCIECFKNSDALPESPVDKRPKALMRVLTQLASPRPSPVPSPVGSLSQASSSKALEAEVAALKLTVATLSKQVDNLQSVNMTLQQQILEQEELKAETMLLITQVMTRVSVLELQNTTSTSDFDI
ncbi:hypothetical protein THRCLA_11364 [Thraustotheca clavata]|uniref:FYVE-type domain-containing protein n=1 Tax=Thraustotheca clavata TaxID=74557 RepID=A0A1V9Y819_9STRA|nr:hypothetical protein THRCLA_11364 [Thraustotheca clavata]